LGLVFILSKATLFGQMQTMFTVTVAKPEHGTIAISPRPPADCKLATDSVITVTAAPGPGFAVDSVFATQKLGCVRIDMAL